VNRRQFVSTAAAVPLAATAQTRRNPGSVSADPTPDLVNLSAGDLLATFDRARGVLWAVQSRSDALHSNFVGNRQNVRRAVDATGDVVLTVWAVTDPGKLKTDLTGATTMQAPGVESGVARASGPSGAWQRESTERSADIRKCSFDGTRFSVTYSGKSQNEDGIRSCDITSRYSLDSENRLIWDLSIRNTTGVLLEVGELALPFLVNDDYGSYGIQSSDVLQGTAAKQRNIHEQKVLSHHFIGGHSSYSLLQRPMGAPPFLLIHPIEDTAFECMYKAGPANGFGGRGGPDLLALHSFAARVQNRWPVPWVNGHTSLLLQPGEERHYKLAFHFIQDYPQIRDEIVKAGNVGVRIVPAMVVQEGAETFVELRSQAPLDRIGVETPFVHSDGVEFRDRKREGEKELLTLAFRGRGQKTIRVEYGNGRWTNLHFYCVEDMADLLKARSRFIVERQFYENPSDPYHRHHAFLPYDYRRRTTFTDSESVWEVGASDEFGFSEALFLAEKNVYYPSRQEIATLESYVSDCLFKYIQNPETYEVRASLYWKDRKPSSGRGAWNEERSKSVLRTYNYAHPANIYYALYRIGKEYGLGTHYTPLEYLRMSYRTALVWFVTGDWKHVGIMCGSNAVRILEDLKKEGWTDEYNKLRAEMEACNKVMVDDPYPFSSELTIDQTAHEQVYFFTKYFGSREKNDISKRVVKALRGGNEPVWFRYGQDRRNFWSCWYSESLNGMALLDAFDDTGDPDMFVKGYAGVMCVAANLLPDGMGFSQFVWSPDQFAHDPNTKEGGQGQWGFMQSARAYVLQDEAFGLIGAGCHVEQGSDQTRIVPKDGLRKVVVYPAKKLHVRLTQGEIAWMSIQHSGDRLEFSITDTTGILQNAALSIHGLPRSRYSVHYGTTSRSVSVSDSLDLKIPIGEAQSLIIQRA
jgi:hypothetical protein